MAPSFWNRASTGQYAAGERPVVGQLIQGFPSHRITLLQREIHEFYSNFRVSNNLIELRNLLQAAELIVKSALHRKESRGLHYTLDYPALAAEAKDTVLVP